MADNTIQYTGDIETAGRQDELQTRRRLLIARLRQMVMTRVIYPPFRQEMYELIDELKKELGLDD